VSAQSIKNFLDHWLVVEPPWWQANARGIGILPMV
jgi:hypothetical protein